MAEVTTLTNGMKVVTPTPVGEGGQALNDNFGALDDFLGSRDQPGGFAGIDEEGTVAGEFIPRSVSWGDSSSVVPAAGEIYRVGQAVGFGDGTTVARTLLSMGLAGPNVRVVSGYGTANENGQRLADAADELLAPHDQAIVYLMAGEYGLPEPLAIPSGKTLVIAGLGRPRQSSSGGAWSSPNAGPIISYNTGSFGSGGLFAPAGTGQLRLEDVVLVNDLGALVQFATTDSFNVCVTRCTLLNFSGFAEGTTGAGGVATFEHCGNVSSGTRVHRNYFSTVVARNSQVRVSQGGSAILNVNGLCSQIHVYDAASSGIRYQTSHCQINAESGTSGVIRLAATTGAFFNNCAITGGTVSAASAVNAALWGCGLSAALGANVTNTVTTSGNVVDANIPTALWNNWPLT